MLFMFCMSMIIVMLILFYLLYCRSHKLNMVIILEFYFLMLTFMYCSYFWMESFFFNFLVMILSMMVLDSSFSLMLLVFHSRFSCNDMVKSMLIYW